MEVRERMIINIIGAKGAGMSWAAIQYAKRIDDRLKKGEA